MAKSPLDDPNFPSAKMYGGRATEPVQQQPPNEEIARLRKQVESLLRDRLSEEQAPSPSAPQTDDEQLGTAARFGGRAALPPEQPKKKSIHNSEVLQFIKEHLPSEAYIQRTGWPEEAKATLIGLIGMLVGIVAGVHLNGEQVAIYLKDLKDETS